MNYHQRLFSRRLLACVIAATWAMPGFSQSATWSGQVQCQLSVQANGVTHQETQTWKLTGAAPTMSGAIAVYPAVWSVSGEGAAQRAANNQVVSGLWKTTVAPTNTNLAIFIRASDSRLVVKSYHAQLSAQSAIIGIQQLAIAGAAPTQRTMQNTAYEWVLPVIEDSGTSTSVSGAANVMVSGNQLAMQASPPANANCTWQFSKSTPTPASQTPLTATAKSVKPTTVQTAQSPTANSAAGGSAAAAGAGGTAGAGVAGGAASNISAGGAAVGAGAPGAGAQSGAAGGAASAAGQSSAGAAGAAATNYAGNSSGSAAAGGAAAAGTGNGISAGSAAAGSPSGGGTAGAAAGGSAAASGSGSSSCQDPGLSYGLVGLHSPTILGTMPAGASQSVSANLSSATERHYYQITLPAGVDASVSLSGMQSGSDFDLYLYDANLSPIGCSLNTGTTSEAFKTQFANAQTSNVVIIGVTPRTWNSAASGYSLSTSAIGVGAPLQLPNNAQARARPVALKGPSSGPTSSCQDPGMSQGSVNPHSPAILGTINAGQSQTVSGNLSSATDRKFYQVTVAAGANATISLAGIQPGSDFDLYIYDASVTPIGCSLNTGTTPESFKTQFANAQTNNTLIIGVAPRTWSSVSENFTVTVQAGP